MKKKNLRVTASLQEKNGKFYIVARIPDATGKLKQKWISTGLAVAGNKRRAKKVLDDKLLELQDEFERASHTASWAVADVGDIPFINILDRWMIRKQRELAPSTVEGYHRILVRLRPYFQQLNLQTKEVSPKIIDDYSKHLLNEGLSPNTVRHHLTLLKSAFNDEIRSGAPILNPVKCVKPPKMETFEANTYGVDELKQLFDFFKGDELEDIIQLAALYGLRRSEILGLRWSDIDFNNKILHIRHKVIQIKVDGAWRLVKSNNLKTDASRRSFPISEDIENLLLARTCRIAERKKSDLGYYNGDSEYVFVDPKGHLIFPNWVTDRFRHRLAHSGLPKLRFHDLRHSCATLLLKNGCSLREIQAYLGHATYTTTTRYAHVDAKSKQHALDALDQALLGNR